MRLWDDSAGRDDESKTYVSEIVSWNYFSFDSSDFCRLSGLRFGRETIGTGQGTTTGGNRRADLRGDYQDLEESQATTRTDRRHHARRRKIAEDETPVRDIEHSC